MQAADAVSMIDTCACCARCAHTARVCHWSIPPERMGGYTRVMPPLRARYPVVLAILVDFALVVYRRRPGLLADATRSMLSTPFARHSPFLLQSTSSELALSFTQGKPPVSEFPATPIPSCHRLITNLLTAFLSFPFLVPPSGFSSQDRLGLPLRQPRRFVDKKCDTTRSIFNYDTIEKIVIVTRTLMNDS